MMPKKGKTAFSGRPRFYGTTVVGERGQAVIPAEARRTLDLKKGDKLLVFGAPSGLCFTKLSGLEKFQKHLSQRLAAIREMLKKNAKKNS